MHEQAKNMYNTRIERYWRQGHVYNPQNKNKLFVQYCYEFPHISNVLKYFLFHFRIKSFCYSCFHVLLFLLMSFIFYYFTFYGKAALPPIDYQAKMPTAKMLTRTVLRAHSCMASVTKGKWTLSSLDWLVRCFTAVSTVPCYFLSASHSPVTFTMELWPLSYGFCAWSFRWFLWPESFV